MQQPMPECEVQPARAERRPVSMRAFARRVDGSTVDVKLLNLSYDGCRVRSEGPFEIGERLSLMVSRRGIIEAEVRWFGDGMAGLRFAVDEAS